jgi:hypothetical protein
MDCMPTTADAGYDADLLGSAESVAQTAGLLYRRPPACQLPLEIVAPNAFAHLADEAVGDTAGQRPAIQTWRPAGVPVLISSAAPANLARLFWNQKNG